MDGIRLAMMGELDPFIAASLFLVSLSRVSISLLRTGEDFAARLAFARHMKSQQETAVAYLPLVINSLAVPKTRKL